jgi:PAS domain S-box-containing protein
VTGLGSGSVLGVAGLVACAAAAGACVRAARRDPPPSRRAWWLLAAFAAVWGTAACLRLVSGHDTVRDWPETATFCTAALLAVIAMRMFQGAPTRLPGQARTLVDGLIVAGSVLFIAWNIGLDGLVGEASAGRTMVLGPVLAEVVLASCATVLLTRSRPAARAGLALMASGFTAVAVADGAAAYQALGGSAGFVDVLGAGWVVGWLSIVATSLRRPPRATGEELEPGLPTQASVLIPSVPFAGAVVAGAAAAAGGGLDPFVIWVGAIVVVLIVMRQVLALLENISFWRDLKARVESRTDDLERSEARFRSLVQTTSDIIILVDRRLTFRYVSPACEAVLGFASSQLEGLPFATLLRAGDVEPFTAQLREVSGQTGPSAPTEWMLRRKDGSLAVVEVVATSQVGESTDGSLVLTARDITDRRLADEHRAELERRLEHSQRMESIGQLAGGIAHDFNNLLAVILNYATFVAEQLPAEHAIREDVDEIRGAAQRAAALTHQLLVFSRREVITPEVLDLNGIVADMQRLLRRTIGEHVEIHTSFAAGVAAITADRSQIEQVVMNLAVNARDAMPEGGTLRIATVRRPGFIQLTVRDSGCGMAEEVAARAFEPFFTTKPKEKGSGLGLATVYGVVIQAGGEIDLRSAPGRGTTIEVRFPAAAAEPAVAATDPRILASLPILGDDTVLLVEDERPVRELTRRILARHGHTVLTASSPREALRQFADHGRPVDLLLTDVVMPHMSGRELAERMREIQPGLRVLYMSGYDDEIVSRHGVLDPGIPLLEKPFDAQALLAGVRDALSRI